jgi:hypothetical protein
VSTARNLRLKTATLTFHKDYATVKAYPYKEAKMYALSMYLGGRNLDWQVESTAQVFHTLRTVFSAVEHLTLRYDRHLISPEWSDEGDRTPWCELLGSFDNVKTLFVCGELVEQLSRALQPGEGEPPTEQLLPQLQELSYFGIGPSHNAFIPFIDARQKVGHPVTVIHP